MFFRGITTLSDLILAEIWPVEFFVPPNLPTFLNSISVVDFTYRTEGTATIASLVLAAQVRLALKIPGFEGAELALQTGPAASADALLQSPPSTDEQFTDLDEPYAPYSFNGLTFFQTELFLGNPPALSFPNLALVLRFETDILKPVGPDGQAEDGPVEIILPGSLRVDSSFNVAIQGFDAFDLPPVMIGNSGIVISAHDVKIDLDRVSSPQEIKDAGFGEDFLGVFIGQAELKLPEGLSGIAPAEAILQNAAIGSDGVSGSAIISNGDPQFEETTRSYTGKGAGSLFGIPFYLSELRLTIKKNAFIESSIIGEVVLPFFDRRVKVKLGFDGNNSVTAQVTGVVEPGDTLDNQGLLTLNVAGQVRFDISSLAIENKSGLAQLRMAARITPTVGGLHWPSFEVKEFIVDSHGHVKVDGGWIDLPNHGTLDLHGFIVEITRIGFGNDPDGSDWIGFSGSMRIVEGFPAGASVDGLRIRRKGNDISLSLSGVGIDLAIAKVLSLKGRLTMESEELHGAVQLGLESPKLTFDGQFRAGKITRDGQTAHFLAVFVDLQLPAGVPLAASGISLYGVAGLFGYNMEPGRGPQEGWYHNPDFSKGWFPKDPAGVTGLDKWRPTIGSLAFGAGVTFGTSADDGNKFNGRLVLVLVFPGPIIILEGRANLFKKRQKLLEGEPTFLAAAIYDGRAGTFLVGLDAQYKYKSKGELLDLRGSAEAFFNLKDRRDWHLFLGQKDPNKRLRARAFRLFDVNAFFMLDPRTLDMGSGWAFKKGWSFGRLSVSLSASFEEEAIVSFRPNHMTGIMAMQGRAELRAFGRGVGVNASAQVQADVFDPKHLRGDFKVGINLPWPLPDISKTVTLEWKEALNQPPPLPLPVREAAIEHGKSTLRWPVVRGQSLLPNNDEGGLERRGSSKPLDPPGSSADPPGQQPLVAADSKLGLVFGRAVTDPGLIGGNATTVPSDVVGDLVNKRGSYQVTYALKTLVLQKRAPSATLATPEWVTVAQKGQGVAETNVPLFGAWTPEEPPELPEAAATATAHSQVKLMVNAKSPFESTSLISPEWMDSFEAQHPGYPCPPGTDTSKLCVDFAAFEDGDSFQGEIKFDDPPFELSWLYGGVVAGGDEPGEHGLRVATSGTASPGTVRIKPPPGATETRIRVGTPFTLHHEPPEFGNPRGAFRPNDTTQTIHMLDGSVAVTTFDRTGRQRTTNTIRAASSTNPLPALLVGDHGDFAQLVPAEPALVVELDFDAVQIINGGEDATHYADVELYDSVDATQAFQIEPIPFNSPRPLRIRLKAPSIAKVVVRAITTDSSFYLQRVYFRTPVVAQVLRGVFDGTFPVFREKDGVVVVQDEDISEILLGSICGGEFLIDELCLPDLGAIQIDNAVQSLERFRQEDALLDPQTDYRLVVTTRQVDKNGVPPGFTKGPADASAINADNTFVEHMYFRVVGPPGVGLPSLPPSADAPPVTGLEDLRLYVERTVPESTVDGPNGKPALPRGVYRAYDLKAEFNENYVESMYKRARRDLTLRVYDATNAPVLDPDGHVLIGQSSWIRRQTALKDPVERWIRMVNNATCSNAGPFDPAQVIGDQALGAPDERVLLAPETLHQARLVPSLVRESFVAPIDRLIANGQDRRLERWVADNAGTSPTNWQILFESVTTPEGPAKIFYVTETDGAETSLLYDGPLAAEDNDDRPAKWGDLRASVKLSWDGGEAGIEVRRGSDIVRVSFDRSGARRLIYLAGGGFDVRAEDSTTFPPIGSNIVLMLECTGDRARVTQDGQDVFDEGGAPTGFGTVGLYVKNAAGPRFSDVTVDDLRANPAVAFKFDFVTSKYVNFHHHLHSFDDRSFEAGLEAVQIATPALVALLERAVPYSATVSDDEQRACEELLEALLGLSGALARPERVEALRITRGGAVIGVLLRSPDPLLWPRILFGVDQPSSRPIATTPGKAKLSALAFTGAEPENVTVLARSRVNLSGFRLDFRTPPASATDDPAWTEYFTFPDEDTAPEGSQTRVYSSAPDAAPPREPGMRQRFVFDDPAAAHDFFGGQAVEIRLVGPGDVIAHQRIFLPEAAYSTVDIRVLRKRDGTELFIVAPPRPTAPTELTETDLRLSMTFQRQQDANPVVLSQAGSTRSESAVLGVPLK